MPTAPSCPQGIMLLRLETVPALGARGRWTRHSRGTSPRTGSGLLHLTWPRILPTPRPVQILRAPLALRGPQKVWLPPRPAPMT